MHPHLWRGHQFLPILHYRENCSCRYLCPFWEHRESRSNIYGSSRRGRSEPCNSTAVILSISMEIISGIKNHLTSPLITTKKLPKSLHILWRETKASKFNLQIFMPILGTQRKQIQYIWIFSRRKIWILQLYSCCIIGMEIISIIKKNHLTSPLITTKRLQKSLHNLWRERKASKFSVLLLNVATIQDVMKSKPFCSDLNRTDFLLLVCLFIQIDGIM